MKVISIEKVNVLVQYAFGIKSQYGPYAIGEADWCIRILTDGGTIATRYVIGSEQCLEEQTRAELVADTDEVVLVDPNEVPLCEFSVVQWVMNEVLNGNKPFEAITYVVSALAKHGLWEPPMYQWVEKAYEELKKQNLN